MIYYSYLRIFYLSIKPADTRFYGTMKLFMYPIKLVLTISYAVDKNTKIRESIRRREKEKKFSLCQA